MRRILIAVLLVGIMIVPCNAMDFTAPIVPESGARYMPDETESFSEGLFFVFKSAINDLSPTVSEVLRTCASLVSLSLLLGALGSLAGENQKAFAFAGTAAVALLILRSTDSLIRLGVDTAMEITQYGKLLLPVMAGALAAQGAITSSGTMYAATAFLNAILSSAVTRILMPLLYVFLCLCIASRLADVPVLHQLRATLKGFAVWSMKIILYVFTGYISITGVVSGTTDAAMLKATKITISSVVPVVGGILSDASEAVLVSAGIMKNAAGIYGMLAMLAVVVGPFLKIGLQYILLKITSGIATTFSGSSVGALIKDISECMGMVLAMIGTICVLLMVGTICFMKGVG